jgi:hypothetical protein
VKEKNLLVHADKRSSDGASTQPAAIPVTNPASQLQTGSLLYEQHAQYGDIYAEVLAPWDDATQSTLAAWQGLTWRLTQPSQQAGIILQPEGGLQAQFREDTRGF